MKTKWIVPVAALFVILAGALWWRGRHAALPPQPVGNETSRAGNQQPATPATVPHSSEAALRSAANELSQASTSAGKNQALAHLREALQGSNTNEMVAAIRQLLDAKTDAATGQGFKIGGGGALLEAPTLRTWLLEQLAKLDPAAAAAYSQEILNTSTSPDEWALALRNLARGDRSADGRALLATKTGELLRNEAWQREASVGYLEAFDTAVQLGGTKLLSPLTALVIKQDNQAVAHAAFLTLDRLVINEPVETLAALNANPDWMTGRAETRANYFARADVSDAAQRQLVESYLLNAARSPPELQAFAGVFPNANFMISQNLLTENATLNGATLAQRDRAALEVVNQWLADPRFEKLKSTLTKIQGRLQEFTRSAK